MGYFFLPIPKMIELDNQVNRTLSDNHDNEGGQPRLGKLIIWVAWALCGLAIISLTLYTINQECLKSAHMKLTSSTRLDQTSEESFETWRQQIISRHTPIRNPRHDVFRNM